jgi:hypothetical protein
MASAKQRRPHISAPRCSEILDGFLFLSDMGVALDPPACITHVVNATNRCVPNAFEGGAGRTCVYYNVDLDDAEGAPIAEHFEGVGRFIGEARRGGGAVLVHCMCGVSRSASLVLSYLMAAEGMTLRAAFAHAKARRPVIAPNPTFARALQRRERALGLAAGAAEAGGCGGSSSAGADEDLDASSSLPASEMVSKNWNRAKANARRARGALDGLGCRSGSSPGPVVWGAVAMAAAAAVATAVIVTTYMYLVAPANTR